MALLILLLLLINYICMEYKKNVHTLEQGCTYPSHQVTLMTKFCMMAPNILGPQYGTWFI